MEKCYISLVQPVSLMFRNTKVSFALLSDITMIDDDIYWKVELSRNDN